MCVLEQKHEDYDPMVASNRLRNASNFLLRLEQDFFFQICLAVQHVKYQGIK